MGIFNDILDRLRRKDSTTAADKKEDTAPVLQNVDVEAMVAEMAAKKGGGGNYKISIVDLLKLLDIDSSLAARAGRKRRQCTGQPEGLIRSADFPALKVQKPACTILLNRLLC